MNTLQILEWLKKEKGIREVPTDPDLTVKISELLNLSLGRGPVQDAASSLGLSLLKHLTFTVDSGEIPVKEHVVDGKSVKFVRIELSGQVCSLTYSLRVDADGEGVKLSPVVSADGACAGKEVQIDPSDPQVRDFLTQYLSEVYAGAVVIVEGCLGSQVNPDGRCAVAPYTFWYKVEKLPIQLPTVIPWSEIGGSSEVRPEDLASLTVKAFLVEKRGGNDLDAFIASYLASKIHSSLPQLSRYLEVLEALNEATGSLEDTLTNIEQTLTDLSEKLSAISSVPNPEDSISIYLGQRIGSGIPYVSARSLDDVKAGNAVISSIPARKVQRYLESLKGVLANLDGSEAIFNTVKIDDVVASVNNALSLTDLPIFGTLDNALVQLSLPSTLFMLSSLLQLLDKGVPADKVLSLITQRSFLDSQSALDQVYLALSVVAEDGSMLDTMLPLSAILVGSTASSVDLRTALSSFVSGFLSGALGGLGVKRVTATVVSPVVLAVPETVKSGSSEVVLFKDAFAVPKIIDMAVVFNVSAVSDIENILSGYREVIGWYVEVAGRGTTAVLRFGDKAVFRAKTTPLSMSREEFNTFSYTRQTLPVSVYPVISGVTVDIVYPNSTAELVKTSGSKVAVTVDSVQGYNKRYGWDVRIDGLDSQGRTFGIRLSSAEGVVSPTEGLNLSRTEEVSVVYNVDNAQVALTLVPGSGEPEITEAEVNGETLYSGVIYLDDAAWSSLTGAQSEIDVDSLIGAVSSALARVNVPAWAGGWRIAYVSLVPKFPFSPVVRDDFVPSPVAALNNGYLPYILYHLASSDAKTATFSIVSPGSEVMVEIIPLVWNTVEVNGAPRLKFERAVSGALTATVSPGSEASTATVTVNLEGGAEKPEVSVSGTTVTVKLPDSIASRTAGFAVRFTRADDGTVILPAKELKAVVSYLTDTLNGAEVKVEDNKVVLDASTASTPVEFDMGLTGEDLALIKGLLLMFQDGNAEALGLKSTVEDGVSKVVWDAETMAVYLSSHSVSPRMVEMFLANAGMFMYALQNLENIMTSLGVGDVLDLTSLMKALNNASYLYVVPRVPKIIYDVAEQNGMLTFTAVQAESPVPTVVTLSAVDDLGGRTEISVPLGGGIDAYKEVNVTKEVYRRTLLRRFGRAILLSGHSLEELRQAVEEAESADELPGKVAGILADAVGTMLKAGIMPDAVQSLLLSGYVPKVVSLTVRASNAFLGDFSIGDSLVIDVPDSLKDKLIYKVLEIDDDDVREQAASLAPDDVAVKSSSDPDVPVLQSAQARFMEALKDGKVQPWVLWATDYTGNGTEEGFMEVTLFRLVPAIPVAPVQLTADQVARGFAEGSVELGNSTYLDGAGTVVVTVDKVGALGYAYGEEPSPKTLTYSVPSVTSIPVPVMVSGVRYLAVELGLPTAPHTKAVIVGETDETETLTLNRHGIPVARLDAQTITNYGLSTLHAASSLTSLLGPYTLTAKLIFPDAFMVDPSARISTLLTVSSSTSSPTLLSLLSVADEEGERLATLRLLQFSGTEIYSASTEEAGTWEYKVDLVKEVPEITAVPVLALEKDRVTGFGLFTVLDSKHDVVPLTLSSVEVEASSSVVQTDWYENKKILAVRVGGDAYSVAVERIPLGAGYRGFKVQNYTPSVTVTGSITGNEYQDYVVRNVQIQVSASMPPYVPKAMANSGKPVKIILTSYTDSGLARAYEISVSDSPTASLMWHELFRKSGDKAEIEVGGVSFTVGGKESAELTGALKTAVGDKSASAWRKWTATLIVGASSVSSTHTFPLPDITISGPTEEGGTATVEVKVNNFASIPDRALTVSLTVEGAQLKSASSCATPVTPTVSFTVDPVQALTSGILALVKVKATDGATVASKVVAYNDTVVKSPAYVFYLNGKLMNLLPKEVIAVEDNVDTVRAALAASSMIWDLAGESDLASALAERLRSLGYTDTVAEYVVNCLSSALTGNLTVSLAYCAITKMGIRGVRVSPFSTVDVGFTPQYAVDEGGDVHGVVTLDVNTVYTGDFTVSASGTCIPGLTLVGGYIGEVEGITVESAASPLDAVADTIQRMLPVLEPVGEKILEVTKNDPNLNLGLLMGLLLLAFLIG